MVSITSKPFSSRITQNFHRFAQKNIQNCLKDVQLTQNVNRFAQKLYKVAQNYDNCTSTVVAQ